MHLQAITENDASEAGLASIKPAQSKTVIVIYDSLLVIIIYSFLCEIFFSSVHMVRQLRERMPDMLHLTYS